MRFSHTSLLDDYCSQLGSLLDRRNTERALSGARQHAERAARLAEDAARQAQAADRAKTNFLANVTHELRTPLNAIIGFSEIIGTNASPAEHAIYSKYIHEAGTRLLGIVNDVLTLARIEADKLDLDEQIASLDEVIGAAIRPFLAEAEAKAISIAPETETDHIVFIDPSKIKQVLVHLLSNAVKFTGERGAIRVTAALDPGKGDLVVSVSDTGCGIPEEDLERVIEPFGQVEDHLTRENDGVGLGLPLARAMAVMHGGDLTLTSKVGVGTVAAIRIPADRLRNSPIG